MKSALFTALGAGLTLAAGAAAYYFGNYVLLSPDDQNMILFNFHMLQRAVEACQSGM